MIESEMSENQQLLTDLLLGRLDPAAQQQLNQRIETDPALKRTRDDIRNTLAALELATEIEPPGDLVQRTMARIQTAKQTDALLAREQLARRDVIRPTFSMREIAAVASIVLIVGVVFGVWFHEADRRKLQTQCAQNAARIGAGLISFSNRNEGRLPSTADSSERWLPGDNQPASSNSRALFQLVRDQTVEPPAFQCPAVGGESFVVQPGMVDFPAARHIGYSYQHSVGQRGMSREDKRLQGVWSSMAILADSSPVFSNGQFRAEYISRPSGDNHGGTGQTVLYLDGHVAFKAEPSVGVGGDNIYLAEGISDYKGIEKPSSPTDTFLLPAWSPPTR